MARDMPVSHMLGKQHNKMKETESLTYWIENCFIRPIGWEVSENLTVIYLFSDYWLLTPINTHG